MAWTEPLANGHRGVYRGPDGTKHKTTSFPSKKKAVQEAQARQATPCRGSGYVGSPPSPLSCRRRIEHRSAPGESAPGALRWCGYSGEAATQ